MKQDVHTAMENSPVFVTQSLTDRADMCNGDLTVYDIPKIRDCR